MGSKKTENKPHMGIIDNARELKELIGERIEILTGMIDAARDAIVMLDNRGFVEYMNRAAEDLFGYTSREVFGRELHPLVVPPAMMAAYRKGFAAYIKTGRGAAIGKTLELTAKRKDGKEITVELSLASMKIREIWHAIGVVRDISDRKRMEKALADKNAFLKAIITKAPMALGVYDREGNCIEANTSLVRMIGAKNRGQVLSQNFHRIESWRASGLYEIAVASLGEMKYHHAILHIGTTFGKSAWLHFHLLPFGPAENANLILMASDITDLKKSENIAIERSTFIATLLETIPNPVFSKDTSLKYTGGNRAFEEFVGKKRARFIGKTVFEIASGEIAAEYDRKDRELLENPPHQIYEYIVQRPGGEKREVVFNKAVFNNADGTPGGIVGVILDVTERNIAERILKELSITDELTGLINRRQFNDLIKKEWNRSCRNGNHLSVIMLDIDFFKRYNDRFGHPAGDKCLKEVAGAIRFCSNRPADAVARYGGEEFIALLPETDLPGALYVAERMRAAVETLAISNPGSAVSQRVTISLGVASCIPRPDTALTCLIDAADAALYEAKKNGRNMTVTAGSPVGSCD